MQCRDQLFHPVNPIVVQTALNLYKDGIDKAER